MDKACNATAVDWAGESARCLRSQPVWDGL